MSETKESDVLLQRAKSGRVRAHVTRVLGLSLLLGSAVAFASKPTPNVPVATVLSDFNSSNLPYFVYSDGGGAYQNGVAGVGSYLNTHRHNRISWGEWRFAL